MGVAGTVSRTQKKEKRGGNTPGEGGGARPAGLGGGPKAAPPPGGWEGKTAGAPPPGANRPTTTGQRTGPAKYIPNITNSQPPSVSSESLASLNN